MAKSRQNVIMVKDSGKNKAIAVMGTIIAVLVIIIVVGFTLWTKSKKVSDKINDVMDNAGLLFGSEAQAQVVEHTTTIEEIIGIEEIQTLEYKYDAICKVYSSPTDQKPAYYIAYTGTVTLGIDAAMISTDYGSDTNKVITVKLPPIQILDCSVNAGTLDYLFINTLYNNSNTSITAQAKCEEDLRKRIENDNKMFEYAKKNAESQIRALTEPLVSQLYPDYKLEIGWKEG